MPALLRAALAAALLLGPLLPHARAEGLSWVVVTGVAEGDVLNVREAPDGDARVLGALSPGALVVSSGETARSSVEWTRVASGEGSSARAVDTSCRSSVARRVAGTGLRRVNFA